MVVPASISATAVRALCYPGSSFLRSPRCNIIQRLQPTGNDIRRRLLSTGGNGAKPSSSSSSAMLQNLAIFAVAGGLGYGAMALFNGSGDAAGDVARDGGPVAPSAPITSRVFFDISIDGRPTGRIVMGLYGSTTPKTCQNFETLCKGTASQSGRQLRWVVYEVLMQHGFCLPTHDFCIRRCSLLYLASFE